MTGLDPAIPREFASDARNNSGHDGLRVLRSNWVSVYEISFCSRCAIASAVLSGVKVAVKRPSGFIT